MDVQIFTRNLELTDRLREYVEKKAEKFDRYLPNIEQMRIDLTAANARDASRRMVAQMTIHAPRAILRAEERSGDIFAAVDAMMDKMYRQVDRYKGRREDRRAPGAPSVPDVVAEVFEEPQGKEAGEEGVTHIVRMKEFEISSITPNDAIDQMELLGHQFFVFRDGTDGRVSVVYKREDGDYGLLKPRD